MHQRTVIRHAVRDLLLNATDAGERVYATRVLPYRRNGPFPVIGIYSLRDTGDPESANTAPREITRELPIEIEFLVEAGDNVDDSLDALAKQIEDLMNADPFLGGAVADSIYDETIMEAIEDGDRVLGWATITYRITYRTDAPQEAAGLDDFETVGATYNVGNTVHEDDDAHDVFIVEAE